MIHETYVRPFNTGTHTFI